MIRSFAFVPLSRPSCCPRGTRGGLIWKRWNRLQSSSALGSFDESFNFDQILEDVDVDVDVAEHFEIPILFDKKQEGRKAITTSATEYSLGIHEHQVPRYVKLFTESINSSHFNDVMAYFKALNSRNLASHLTGTDYSNIIASANPKELLPTSSIARYIKGSTAPEANPYVPAYKKFWGNIKLVLQTMTISGHQPTALDYTNLMAKAVFTRSPHLLNTFWEHMMKSGVRPNTWTYNSRIASVAGIQPWNHMKRFPTVHHQDYVEKWKNNKKSSLTESMSMYEEMLKIGLFPNSMTIELLIMAHSRVGDVAGIDRLVQNVYGLVVDEEGTELPAGARPAITIGSPIYPSPKTLKTLAIAYCRNGKFASALQTVDLLSKLYAIEIRDETWDILLTYSYALSRPKYNILPHGTAELLAAQMRERTGREISLQSRDILIRSLCKSDDPSVLENARNEIRQAVSYYRTKIQHRYLMDRERWINTPENSQEARRRQQSMNDSLYNVSKWKDAMGQWLYAFLRAHWQRVNLAGEPVLSFENIQNEVLSEFGIYWHQYRPVFKPPKNANEKIVVGPRIYHREKFPRSMKGVQGSPTI